MANLSNINGKFVVEQTTGYVGIGDTDPDYLLHLASADAVNGTRLAIENTNGSGKVYGLIADNTGVFSLRDLTASTDRFAIASGGDATFSGDITVTGGDITIGTDAIAGNINCVGDVLALNVDSNTGGGAGANIQLKTAGTAQLTVTSSSATFAGKILAGTGATAAATINAYTATVSASLYSALRIIENSGASSYWDIGATGGGTPNLNFYVNAGTTPKLTIDGTGNVGIGVTPNAWYSAYRVLELNSGGAIYGTTTGVTLAQNLYFNTSASWTTRNTTAGGLAVNDGGAFIWYTNPATTAGAAAALYERMRITNDGDVGIGTASPQELLDVNTNPTGLNVDNTVAIFGNDVGTTQSRDTWIKMRASAATNDYTWAFGTQQAGDFRFNYLGTRATAPTSGSTRMTIESGGNVGIGTTSPQKNLQIFQTEGGVGVKHATIRLGGYSTVGPDIAAYRVTGNSNDQGLIFSTYDATAGTVDTMTLTNDGDVGIGTTSPDTKLHLYDASAGDVALKIEASSAGDPKIVMTNETANRSGSIIFHNHLGTQMGDIRYLHLGDKMEFYTGGTGASHLELSLNETAGAVFRTKVGIGTGDPYSILEVTAPTTKTNLGTVSNQTITLSGGGGVGEYSQIGFGYTAGDYSPAVIGYITTDGGVSTKGALIFATRDSTTASAPTERMRITSAGLVGIGKAPSALLTMKDAAYVQEWDRAKGFYQHTTATVSAAGDFNISTIINTNNLRGLTVDYYESGHLYNNGNAYYFRHTRLYIMIEGTSLRIGTAVLIQSLGNRTDGIVSAPTVTASAAHEATIVSTILSGFTHYVSVDIVGSGFSSFESIS